MPQITRIPAKRKQVGSSDPGFRKRRVAAYARVSTDSDEQATSYENQIDYYQKYINSRDDWTLVKIYTDDGISGTSTKRREGFNSMVNDALDGKIDLIVTKSVSRFARNTVDSISTIRQLKENKVEVFFEKENIWTFDGKGELLLTIMSSLAQEESRSISENCTWARRKQAADGKVTLPYSRLLGYDKGPDGQLVINEEQAKVVRKIFEMYLKGHNPSQIARALTHEGIPTVTGNKVWKPGPVQKILQNEKYRGDALLQKTYTVDFLTKKKAVNHGEVPQYYVEKNHEPIIDPEDFDNVQNLIQRRAGHSSKSDHCFANTVCCGECGCFFTPKVIHSTSPKYRKRIWECNNRYFGTHDCTNKYIHETKIEDIFIKEMNKLIHRRKTTIKESKQRNGIKKVLEELDAKLNEINEELNTRSDALDKMLNRSSRRTKEEALEYVRLCEEYEQLQLDYNKIKDKRTDISLQRYAGRRFRNWLENAEPMKAFDEDVWRSFVKNFRIFEDGKIIIELADGGIIETTK